MKNIRFYEAEKYNSDDYEKVEDMIYRNLLSIIGKHVYNKQEGEYVYLKIE